MIAGARWAGASISEMDTLLGFLHTTVSRVYRERCDKQNTSSQLQPCGQKHTVGERGQRNIQASRVTSTMQIIAQRNSDVQTGSLNTKLSNFEVKRLRQQMDGWGVEKNNLPDLTNPGLCCNMQMAGRDFGVNMDPFCQVTTVPAGAGGAMVWMFSWQTLSPFAPTEHCLNTTVTSVD